MVCSFCSAPKVFGAPPSWETARAGNKAKLAPCCCPTVNAINNQEIIQGRKAAWLKQSKTDYHFSAITKSNISFVVSNFDD
jgi:hypothetical protein